MPPALPPRLSVVVPMLDEERNVSRLLDKLWTVLESLGEPFEVVCVDDGSTDGTLRALEDEASRRPGLKLVSLARNFGQHAAVVAGFDASEGHWVVTLDADLQNPPEEIPRLVEELRAGRDLVGTYREDRRDPLVRRCASWALNRAVRCLSRLEIRDLGCMLRGYSRELARAVAREAGPGAYVPALAAARARSPVEIPVRHAPRAEGRSRYSLRTLAGLALDLLRSLGPRARRPAPAYVLRSPAPGRREPRAALLEASLQERG
ncbi:MAG: glycosyltransferase family 2 protein [Planctomycetes bacterium]|nr:glycosyltransferase family 2 protein [Planctomycetota bacterium]